MNRAIIRRWINEYLDGEIGLADKAELERVMAQNPEVRHEYEELRRLGLMLGSIPEVSVHPTRFRARVLHALNSSERIFFTPQRVFAGAMVVALMVIGITFGLLSYQQVVGGNRLIGSSTAIQPVQQPTLSNDVTLAVAAPAKAFFNRLLLEVSCDMTDRSMLDPFLQQTQILEGARCIKGHGLDRVDFEQLPDSVRVKITPRQVQLLAETASGVAEDSMLLVNSESGIRSISDAEFMVNHPNNETIHLVINFKQR